MAIFLYKKASSYHSKYIMKKQIGMLLIAISFLAMAGQFSNSTTSFLVGILLFIVGSALYNSSSD